MLKIVHADHIPDQLGDYTIVNIYPNFAQDNFTLERDRRIQELTKLIRIESEDLDEKMIFCASKENSGRHPGQTSTKRQWADEMKRGKKRR